MRIAEWSGNSERRAQFFRVAEWRSRSGLPSVLQVSAFSILVQPSLLSVLSSASESSVAKSESAFGLCVPCVLCGKYVPFSAFSVQPFSPPKLRIDKCGLRNIQATPNAGSSFPRFLMSIILLPFRLQPILLSVISVTSVVKSELFFAVNHISLPPVRSAVHFNFHLQTLLPPRRAPFCRITLLCRMLPLPRNRPDRVRNLFSPNESGDLESASW